MANTFAAIATVTVESGGAGDITFSSIPQTYTDLYILISARCDRSLYVDDYRILFNGNATPFTYKAMSGDGSGVTSYGGTSNSNNIGVVSAANATANTFSNCSVYITAYTGSDNKAYSAEAVSENNNTSAQQWIVAGVYTNTSAITSIKIDQGDGSNWLEYSTFTLYGIKNS